MKLQVGYGGKNGAGTIGVLALSLFSFSPTLISAETSTTPSSPSEVLEAYRKMDGEGGRLTASGWYRASKFFVKPGRAPQHYVLQVIGGEAVGDGFPWPKGTSNRVRIHVSVDARGQIDSSGRFTPVLDPSLIDPSGRPLTQLAHPSLSGPLPIIQIYDLVLTDTYWEFGPSREGAREVKGPLEWRIETFEFEPRVTIDVAIRYLTKLRDESSSEVIKRNADKSIATLRGLQK
jgi:hypothetical protein